VSDGRGPAAQDDFGTAERALQPFLTDDEARFGLDDLARYSQIDPGQLSEFWRALGFPNPRPGEQLFTSSDVEMLSTLVGLIAEGAIEPGAAKQMARVIGSSLDRIASAQIDAWLRGAQLAEDTEQAAKRSAEMAALLPRVLELVWRRRLVAEARRRLTRASGDGPETTLCVGFADLVGFTAQTQQLDATTLADVVGRFESIAYDVVGHLGGRVVKTIGDEVMFVNDDVAAACRTALELALRYREDEALSDVRVGLALGPVLERDGDVYGHTVNLASRVVTVAYPGSVIVSPEIHDAVKGDERFTFTSLRSHYLKDIGRVPLWRMRLVGDVDEGPYQSARIDRSQRRRILQRRWEDRNRGFQDRGTDVAAALLAESEDLPGRLPSVLAGTATPEVMQSLVEDPTSDELDALAAAILASDIDPDLQLDLLTEIEAASTLRQLELEADHKAEMADREAEQELRRIEHETARTLEAIEADHRERVAAAIAQATEESRLVDERAVRRIDQAAEEAERKAAQATRDARANARRSARQRAQRRGRS
jgi:adenylate cyclase